MTLVSGFSDPSAQRVSDCSIGIKRGNVLFRHQQDSPNEVTLFSVLKRRYGRAAREVTEAFRYLLKSTNLVREEFQIKVNPYFPMGNRSSVGSSDMYLYHKEG